MVAAGVLLRPLSKRRSLHGIAVAILHFISFPAARRALRGFTPKLKDLTE
jgi:hypothetical protein